MGAAPPLWLNVAYCNLPLSQKPSGFTLPELLVVLALFAILMTQLIPDLSAATQQNRLYAIANAFSQQLQLTRNTAIQRNQKISLCKSDSGTQCSTSTQWEAGWILFENLDGDGRVDSVDPILQRYNPLPHGITLRGVGNFKNRITYKPTGDSTSFSRLLFCDQNQLTGSQVIYISSTGRIRIAKDDDGDGIPEDGNGDNIESCET